jgi:hypothetical protein
VALPVAPVEESSEPKPLTPKQAVGYKSLIEANPNRVPVEPAAAAAAPAAAPADDSSDKAGKGNRFFRAVGKIFRPAKDPSSTLQPKE